jgi:hypothetical protein
MAQLIKKVEEVKFNMGDRVEFKVIDQHDNYSPSYKTMYGFALKVNKVSMEIASVDGLIYKEEIFKVKHYVDPFANNIARLALRNSKKK